MAIEPKLGDQELKFLHKHHLLQKLKKQRQQFLAKADESRHEAAASIENEHGDLLSQFISPTAIAFSSMNAAADARGKLMSKGAELLKKQW